MEEKIIWQMMNIPVPIAHRVPPLPEENDDERKTEKKEEKKGDDVGIEIEGKWKPIEQIKTAEVYEKLLQKRRRKTNKKIEFKTNHAITTVSKVMSAKERDYWWRVAHNTISIRQTERHWKKDEEGNEVSNICPVCKRLKEDRGHYNYDCEAMQVFIGRVKEVYDEWADKKNKKEERSTRG